MKLTDRQPDFNQLLKVLRRQKPSRPVLFEFFLNHPLYERLAGPEVCSRTDRLAPFARWIHAYRNAGYDYATPPWEFSPLKFPQRTRERVASIGMNEGGIFTDRAGYESYPWPTPQAGDYDILDDAARELPAGMKLILFGPGGVLENAIALVGYEPLCMIVMEDPPLAQEIFDAIGSRVLAHFELGLKHDCIGAVIVNDDWGFKTQPMLSPPQLRQYVFPWHKRTVQAAHDAGRPAILHSCGNFSTIIDDVIDDMAFDGRHSYEDAIMPVEQAYDRYGRRIAIMGGLDLDFLCRSTPQQVYERATRMLDRTAERGSYALGSGNSIPEYIPTESYFAMVRAALEYTRT
jgi:uroporphyrinogen decarboxylase